jgi:NitT/TauT family transport system substrate-binding protein
MGPASQSGEGSEQQEHAMTDMRVKRTGLPRRGFVGAALSVMAATPLRAGAVEAATVRLGVLKFGTVHWVADVIGRHALDRAHGFSLETVTLANTDAGRVALMAQAVNIAVSDWFFVASQRAAGTKLSFAPFSSASGGVMVPAGSPIRTLGDLGGRRLGVAGGPLDKSWLLVQAAARAGADIDLAAAARVDYGAPPLLNAKLRQGELDAVLTFWNFAARLEADGFREVIPVADCAKALDLPPHMSLVGFVFHEDWARQNLAAVSGFLAAVAEAERLLVTSEAEWQSLRPLMEAPDDAVFANLQQRFKDGLRQASDADQQLAAARLFDILLRTGGKRATNGIEQLPEGIFWRTQ